jgi:riboflavin kinase/FMN adenylyltransferase
VGAKPTVAESQRNIETNISDFKGDLYGKTIEVEFLKRLRDIKKFDTLNDLKHQLEEDKNNIQKI